MSEKKALKKILLTCGDQPVTCLQTVNGEAFNSITCFACLQCSRQILEDLPYILQVLPSLQAILTAYQNSNPYGLSITFIHLRSTQDLKEIVVFFFKSGTMSVILFSREQFVCQGVLELMFFFISVVHVLIYSSTDMRHNPLYQKPLHPN